MNECLGAVLSLMMRVRTTRRQWSMTDGEWRDGREGDEGVGRVMVGVVERERAS
jgi:hypothetical protein